MKRKGLARGDDETSEISHGMQKEGRRVEQENVRHKRRQNTLFQGACRPAYEQTKERAPLGADYLGNWDLTESKSPIGLEVF